MNEHILNDEVVVGDNPSGPLVRNHVKAFKQELADLYRIALKQTGNKVAAERCLNAWLRGLTEGEAAREVV